MKHGMIIEINRCDIVLVIEVMVKLWVCKVLSYRHIIVIGAISISVI